jgi:hypothetical protein
MLRAPHLPWLAGATLATLLGGAAAGQPGPRREGEYGGVVPGQRPEAASQPAKPKRPPPKGTLTWIGFEAKAGGAQVFFQSVAPFEVAQRVEGDALVVRLGLTRLAGNTWRPIDTRFFDNPLARISARAVGAARGKGARGAGIEVRIAFKSPRAARAGALRMGVEADGMAYAYLTFPEGADGSDTGARSPTREPE